jgi:hypothetical protein
MASKASALTGPGSVLGTSLVGAGSITEAAMRISAGTTLGLGANSEFVLVDESSAAALILNWLGTHRRGFEAAERLLAVVGFVQWCASVSVSRTVEGVELCLALALVLLCATLASRDRG